MALEILVGPPVHIPAGVDQHSLTAEVPAFEVGGSNVPTSRAIHADDDRGEIGELFERQLGQIFSMRKTMKGRIEISTGVCHHFNFADVKFGSGGVMGARLLAAQ